MKNKNKRKEKQLVFEVEDEKTLSNFYSFLEKKIREGISVIIIFGPSSSGKTYIAQNLVEFLKKRNYSVVLLQLDNFYREKSYLFSMAYGSFDHIRLFDRSLVNKVLYDLFTKRKAKVPVYSFKVKDRIGFKELKIKENSILILEGLYPLLLINKKFLQRNNVLKVYVDADEEELLIRRIIRDPERTKENLGIIIENLTSVFPFWKVFGEWQKKRANIILKNNFKILSKKRVFIEKKELERGFLEGFTLYKVYNFVYKGKKNSWIIREYYKKGRDIFDFYSLVIKENNERQYIINLREPSKISKLHLLIQNLGFKFDKLEKKDIWLKEDEDFIVEIEKENDKFLIKKIKN